LKHGKSFSIVSRDFNYFGFGSEESWLDNVDRLGEKFYKEYLITHERFVNKEILVDGGIRDVDYHKWWNSRAYYKYRNEIYYRDWFEDLENEVLTDTRRVIMEIESKIKNYKRYTWEARIPNCREICEIFIVEIRQFIVDTIKYRLEKETVDDWDREKI
jgi:hypothetical protein